MMAYESPITLMTEKIANDLADKTEGLIMECVQRVGVSVDKDELVRALNYDRGQYEVGKWDMFQLITSTEYGKQCYFTESNGTVYCRRTGKHLPSKEDAINDYLNYLNCEGEE